MHTIDVIDSHTGGEPTRVVIAGFPDLGGGSLMEQRERFRRESDRFRSGALEARSQTQEAAPHDEFAMAGASRTMTAVLSR